MDRSIRFWNRFANKYASLPVPDQDVYQTKLNRTRSYFKPDAKVLEFGCGTGSTALLHAPHIESIVALDNSQKMIDIANEKRNKEGRNNVDFRCGTVFDINKEHESFDIILGLNILHLVKEWEETIDHCYDVLKPGGIFVTSTQCLSSPFGVLRTVMAIGAFFTLVPSVYFFDGATLEKRMHRAGFETLEQQSFGKKGINSFLIVRKPM